MGYRIGKLADILGVSAETIRYYERVGLVESQRHPQNNYRTFDVVESEQLIDMKSLQHMGFSLSESLEILRSTDLTSCMGRFHELDGKLAKDIEHIEALRSVLARLIATVDHYEQAGGTCRYAVRPDLLRIPIYWEQADPALNALRKAWIAAFPFPSVSPRFRLADGEILYDKGLCILWEDALRLGLSADEPVVRYRPRPCIYAMIEFDQNKPLKLDRLDKVHAYAEQQGLTILEEEDVIGRAFAVESVGEAKTLMIEIWVPVR